MEIKLRKKIVKKKKTKKCDLLFNTRIHNRVYNNIFPFAFFDVSSPFATSSWRKNYFKEILINVISEAPRLIFTCEDFITAALLTRKQKPYNLRIE